MTAKMDIGALFRLIECQRYAFSRQDYETATKIFRKHYPRAKVMEVACSC